MVNVQQQGMDRLGSNLFVIVPRSNFSCNGRITGYMASLNQNRDGFCRNPGIIVWQPRNTEPMRYSIRGFYTLSNDDISAVEDYYFANVSFTGNNRIEFQSGDVIGYWHASSPCYTVWNIRTAGYTSYGIRRFGRSRFFSINDDSTSSRQPLIQVTFGII